MIKAAGKGPLGNFTSVTLGISRGNWERLLANQPIVVDLRDIHPELPDLKVCLLGGETERDIYEDLRAIAPLRPNPYDTEREERQ